VDLCCHRHYSPFLSLLSPTCQVGESRFSSNWFKNAVAGHIAIATSYRVLPISVPVLESCTSPEPNDLSVSQA
jgi:hypothetical protein